MDVKLLVLSGKSAGQAIPISGGKFFIGRAEDCNLRPYSDLISRHHCAILVDQGVVTLRDFGSKNGTLVNGERVRAEVELKNGDRLKVGELEFQLQLTVELVGKKLPKVHNVQEAAARTAAVGARSSDSGDDDLDVMRLLSENTGTLAADSETQTVQMSRAAKKPAASSPVAKTAPAASPTAQTANQDNQEEPQKPVGPKPSAKGYKPPADGSSSQAAAAAMLKNFFKGF